MEKYTIENNILNSKIYQNLSDSLLNMGDYLGSLEGYTKVLEIQKLYGDDHIQYS